MVAQNSSGAESVLDTPEGFPRARPCPLCLQPVAGGVGLFNSLGDKNIACVLALRVEVEQSFWVHLWDLLQATPRPVTALCRKLS